MTIQIAPSILSADFAHLAEEIAAVEHAGADVIHVDVMDGHFVPNITIGPPVVAKIRACTKLPLDCHLMIENPERYIEAFATAGADWLSVHVEACDLTKLLPAIQNLGMKAGCVLNPETPLETLLPFLHLADYVLVMSVHPGFGGQQMIEACLEKIAGLKAFLQEKNLSLPIEVDGGIKASNVKQALDAGAEIIVAGSAIFGEEAYEAAIRALRYARGADGR